MKPEEFARYDWMGLAGLVPRREVSPTGGAQEGSPTSGPGQPELGGVGLAEDHEAGALALERVRQPGNVGAARLVARRAAARRAVRGRFGDEATLFRLASQLEAAQSWRARRPPVAAA
jgi:hypothetical protein